MYSASSREPAGGIGDAGLGGKGGASRSLTAGGVAAAAVAGLVGEYRGSLSPTARGVDAAGVGGKERTSESFIKLDKCTEGLLNPLTSGSDSSERGDNPSAEQSGLSLEELLEVVDDPFEWLAGDCASTEHGDCASTEQCPCLVWRFCFLPQPCSSCLSSRAAGAELK